MTARYGYYIIIIIIIIIIITIIIITDRLHPAHASPGQPGAGGGGGAGRGRGSDRLRGLLQGGGAALPRPLRHQPVHLCTEVHTPPPPRPAQVYMDISTHIYNNVYTYL